jgi:FMN reductase
MGVSEVITIAGSPSLQSRSGAVLKYAREQIEHAGLSTQALRVRDLPAEDLLYARFDSPKIKEWTAAIRQARGLVIATPIYKASFSGILKAWFDLLPQGIFADKLILPIATGGSPAHLLAIDYALRPVLAALGGQHMLQGVYIVDGQIQYSASSIELEEAIELRLQSALHAFTHQLTHQTVHTNTVFASSCAA